MSHCRLHSSSERSKWGQVNKGLYECCQRNRNAPGQPHSFRSLLPQPSSVQSLVPQDSRSHRRTPSNPYRRNHFLRLLLLLDLTRLIQQMDARMRISRVSRIIYQLQSIRQEEILARLGKNIDIGFSHARVAGSLGIMMTSLVVPVPSSASPSSSSTWQ